MTQAKILTVILNYRTPELTIQAAQAAVREMRGLGGEVVIVDNASGDGSFDTIRAKAEAEGWTQDGFARVVQSPENDGFGAGNNFGMRLGMSSGEVPDFFYILNSDAWPDPGAVKKLLDVMQDEPRAGLAGSYIKGTDDAPHCTVFRFPSASGEFEGAARTGFITKLFKSSVVPMEIPTQTSQVDWVAGASVLMRREMLDEIGLFDETFFLYYEETELCRRAARAGWQTFYVPASEVAHVGSASTAMKEWARTPRYWFESRFYYFTKVHGRAYAIWATLARLAGCGIYGLRRVLSGKPQRDPPGFARDLLSHFLAAMVSRGPSRRDVSLARPMTEDSK
ncbi:glycosyltransferase family 2 protein [Roseovarius sp. MMSF_3281]|uniref:glycosyltransferase family 2 protein n=1 Tax=Roseovarius sp. MMSF_3281 TaxID=3046694 RepID=UPI00273D220B|nr:glycosyltransferase family 2 protein [Roseovarius sp. MMSF_3281]